MTAKDGDTALGAADVTVSPGWAPYSSQFRDTYFDVEDGLRESRHVFLDGCDLPRAWRNNSVFTIGETGFGSGLNFLAAWHAWAQAPQKPDRLHYVATEGFPLTPAEIASLHTQWSELASHAGDLAQAYPSLQPGYHRRTFAGGRVVLTLLFGPVLPMLQSLEAKVDAWFLDGFAPDRNPDMWHPDVFAEVARLSHAATQLATFTVAGQVRRDLTAAGFTLEKRPGRNKREVLAGRYTGESESKESRPAPWFESPPPVLKSGGTVAVVGGGLAGANAAYAFRRRGYAVTVIERHETLAAEASATPAAVLMPRLTAGASTDGDFYATAWPTLLTLLGELEAAGHDVGWQRCGTLQLAATQEEEKRQAAIIAAGRLSPDLVRSVPPEKASQLAGVRVERAGLYFPDGGVLSADKLCAALLKDVALRTHTETTTLSRENGIWTLKEQNGTTITTADVVVIAGGVSSNVWPQVKGLPLVPRQGQISRIAPSERSAALKCVVADDGYVTPVKDGTHIIGATFDHVSDGAVMDTRPEPQREADLRNLDLAKSLIPTLFDAGALETQGSWAGVRCTTLDHLPLAGPVPDEEAYMQDYADLRHGHSWSKYPAATVHTGLYVLTGLGAHGSVAAPLAAELIAGQACADPSAVPRSLAHALHPARFLVRALKRGQV